MLFLRSRNYTRTDGRKIDVIVIHTMEAPEKPDTAENVAKWFAGPTAPRASAHYCIDADSIVQCVEDKDVAWAAPGCNHNGIQFEHAGTAKQTSSDWSDPYSVQMLNRSAQLAARLCKRYDIPVRWLTASDLKAGRRGITGHAEVSDAFKRSSHWDPGKNFPVERYLSLIRAELVVRPPKPPLAPTKPVSPEDPHNFFTWARWIRGHGEFKEYGPRNPKVRPNVPVNITRDRPLWWARLLLNTRGT